jgi:SOS-response transcriptional repressor LexA
MEVRPVAHKKVEITDKQKEVLDFWLQHIQQRGFQPSQTEAAAHFGVQRRAILDRLQQLEEKGYIVLPKANQERCIQIVGLKFKAYMVDEEGHPLPETEEVAQVAA